MRTNATKLLFIVSLGVLCVGCPACWHFVFVNGSDSTLLVSFSGIPLTNSIAPGEYIRRLFPIASSVEEFEMRAVRVHDQAGVQLYEVSANNLLWRLQRPAVQHPNVHVLLTTNSAYVIPEQFSKTWREHLDEIISLQRPNKSAAASRLPAGQSDGCWKFLTAHCSRRALSATVAWSSSLCRA